MEQAESFTVHAGSGVYELSLGARALGRLGGADAAREQLLRMVANGRGGVLGVADVRRLIWACLADRHPELTEADAGQLVDVADCSSLSQQLGGATEAALARLVR